MEYQTGELNIEKVEQTKERIRDGFSLNEKFNKLNQPERERLIQTTSERIVELADILEVKIDDLNYNIRKMPGGIFGGALQEKKVGDHSEFTLLFDERNYFGPFGDNPMLKGISDSFTDLNLAHEMYHLRQAQRFPQSWQRTREATRNLGKAKDAVEKVSDYSQDKGEKAARLFALAFVQRRTHGGRSWLSSVLGNLELGAFNAVRYMSKKLDASIPTATLEVK